MALEIERKFIVAGDAWRNVIETTKSIVQAYIAVDGDTSVRVRITDNEKAQITVKIGISAMIRNEFEYVIPIADARALADANVDRQIEKTRHIVHSGGFVWEVDVFSGALSGVVVAEVEMNSETDDPALPSWLGREVTEDPAYSNAMLATKGLPERNRP